MGVRSRREAQLQKKAWWLANAIVRTSPDDEPSGSNIKIASNLSVWSSSTRPGPGPIWRPCGDGRHAARGFPPKLHTVSDASAPNRGRAWRHRDAGAHRNGER